MYASNSSRLYVGDNTLFEAKAHVTHHGDGTITGSIEVSLHDTVGYGGHGSHSLGFCVQKEHMPQLAAALEDLAKEYRQAIEKNEKAKI